MKRPLAYLGDAVLRQKARPVEEITPEIRLLVAEMIETMNAVPDTVAVGIAAPQVHASLRVFIVRMVSDAPDGQLMLHPPEVFINPTLSEPARETEEMSEGCLSIPGLSAPVQRPVSIRIRATDLEGRPFERLLTGFEARVAMHEHDHLNGILYIDRVSAAEKKRLKEPLRLIRQRTQQRKQ